jgi:hypothetical protein
MMVLLKVDWMWAIPNPISLLTFFFLAGALAMGDFPPLLAIPSVS